MYHSWTEKYSTTLEALQLQEHSFTVNMNRRTLTFGLTMTVRCVDKVTTNLNYDDKQRNLQ